MKKLFKHQLIVLVVALLVFPISVMATSIETNFEDVPKYSWFAEPVNWAVEKGITSGTSKKTFSPNVSCNNAQIITFLWRACGMPDSAGDNPFDDIVGGSYYYKAALWAYESGIVGGGSFQPNKPCTRGMAVYYMWKQADCPIVNDKLSFSDVDTNADCVEAIAWALGMGVTSGTSNTTFSPNSTCTRAQIITFLYRNTALRADENQDYDSNFEIAI